MSTALLSVNCSFCVSPAPAEIPGPTETRTSLGATAPTACALRETADTRIQQETCAPAGEVAGGQPHRGPSHWLLPVGAMKPRHPHPLRDPSLEPPPSLKRRLRAGLRGPLGSSSHLPCCSSPSGKQPPPLGDSEFPGKPLPAAPRGGVQPLLGVGRGGGTPSPTPYKSDAQEPKENCRISLTFADCGVFFLSGWKRVGREGEKKSIQFLLQLADNTVPA